MLRLRQHLDAQLPKRRARGVGKQLGMFERQLKDMSGFTGIFALSLLKVNLLKDVERTGQTGSLLGRKVPDLKIRF